MWLSCRGVAPTTTAIFNAEVEERVELYLYSTIATVCFIVVKWTGLGANTHSHI
jgi:hypothetical protein